jgi:hypothetical protein
MTAQHAPPTPLWRRVFSLPKTRLGWWAIGLAGIALALYVVVGADTNEMSIKIENALSTILGVSVTWGEELWAILLNSTWILTGLAGAVVALIAVLRRHERSALVWVAMVAGLPALVIVAWLLALVPYVIAGAIG